jgi:TonB family protein
MKIQHLIRAAALAGGLLSAVPFATAVIVTPVIDRDAPAFTAPAPQSVVAPTGLPRRCLDQVVQVGLTIDEEGRPHNVRLISPRDAALERELLPAVAQWQFRPAQRRGQAVAVEVILPLAFAEQSR